MAKLTAKQEAFIRLMTKSDEHAQRGFQLLSSAPEAEYFFDAIHDVGLFDPDQAPGPIPADEPGFFRIPYWSPLDYLVNLARLSGERKDNELARKVMDVVRGVSRFRDENDEFRDNYHTFSIFAEIIGLVPRKTLIEDDRELFPIWLDSKYDKSLVGTALSKGIITHLLESDLEEDLEWASFILNCCTELRRGKDVPPRRRNKDLVTVVDGYFLKEIIEKHAENLGRKAGKIASSLFVERIRDAFDGEDELPSYMLRPAVEEHEQNRSWNEAQNCLVEGLRDILLYWVLSDPESAHDFVVDMLKDSNDMVRRIGIFLLNERWTELKGIYGDIVGPDLFDSKHIHEMYQLLRNRFDVFNESDKKSTVKAIGDLPLPEIDENPERYRRYRQREWLSSIEGVGFQPADEMFAELNKEKNLGRLSDHPDFHYYMETGWGPGPSPYELDELLSFVDSGSIIEKLNDFEQTDMWRGPSVKGLVTALEASVASQPETFLQILPKFLGARRSYQYGIINGFKKLWDGSNYEKSSIDWNVAWEVLIGFFEELLFDPIFWSEAVNEQKDLTPTRDWIPPIVVEFLRSGTREDKKAYSPDLLPRTLALIKALLNNLEIEDESGCDAMSHAINSSRGKALEALFSHALRACRLADKQNETHAEAWAELDPIFNKEIQMCQDGRNYDFSTHAGAYMVNLSYLSTDWLQSNIENIFPIDKKENFRCAISGLSYASATQDSYQLLMSKGIIDIALAIDLNAEQVRERVIERVALAYLWGDESLDSPRLMFLRAEGKSENLEAISGFFWSVRGQDLSDEQVNLIMSFWEWCIEWGEELSSPPGKLYSSLSRLSCFLDEIDEKAKGLLLEVAPFVSIDHNANNIVEELDRLVSKSAGAVCEILGVVLEGYKPSYDYQDRLKGLLEKLANAGFRGGAIEYMNKVRHLKGIEDLYRKVVQ